MLWAFAAPLPKIMFSDGKIYDNFATEGWAHQRERGLHAGLDFRAPVGTPILAVREGRVVFAGTYNDGNTAIEVIHPDGSAARYLHHLSASVKTGAQIRKGQNIGRTGFAKSPHLHFDLWVLPAQVNEYVQKFGAFQGSGGTKTFSDGVLRVKVPAEPLVPATYQDDVLSAAARSGVRLYSPGLAAAAPKILLAIGVLGAIGFSAYKIIEAQHPES